MTVVIVDASALIEVVPPENATARATFEVLSAFHGFAAPSLVAWELGQVVHRKMRARFRGEPDARADIVEALLDGIRLETPEASAVRDTGRFAELHDLSFYDAAYLELAARTPDSVLVTEDAKLLESAEEVLGADRAFDLEGARAYAVRRRIEEP